MNEIQNPEDREDTSVGPQAKLEKMHIDAYLLSKGYTPEKLKELPEEEAKRLMTEASTYASMKLAEVESRVHFRKEIRSPS